MQIEAEFGHHEGDPSPIERRIARRTDPPRPIS
jgi:hypothetical protein